MQTLRTPLPTPPPPTPTPPPPPPPKKKKKHNNNNKKLPQKIWNKTDCQRPEKDQKHTTGLSILRSQFAEKGFKATGNVDYSVVLLFFLLT